MLSSFSFRYLVNCTHIFSSLFSREVGNKVQDWNNWGLSLVPRLSLRRHVVCTVRPISRGPHWVDGSHDLRVLYLVCSPAFLFVFPTVFHGVLSSSFFCPNFSSSLILLFHSSGYLLSLLTNRNCSSSTPEPWLKKWGSLLCYFPFPSSSEPKCLGLFQKMLSHLLL